MENTLIFNIFAAHKLTEFFYELVKKFIKKIVELKEEIKKFNLSVNEIQKRLTTSAYQLDEDDDFTNTIEDMSKEVDAE